MRNIISLLIRVFFVAVLIPGVYMAYAAVDDLKVLRIETKYPGSRSENVSKRVGNVSTLNSLTRKTIKPCWGINTHKRYTDEEFSILEQLGSAGLQIVRFSYSWQEIEKNRGEYSFNSPPGWQGNNANTGPLLTADEYLTSLSEFGIRLSAVLLSSTDPSAKQNQWYLKQPYEPLKGLRFFQPCFGEPKYVRAFGEYCARMVRKYGRNGLNLIREWEVWNEPNNRRNVESYVKVLKEAYKRIKQEDPEAKVIGMATSRIDSKFIEECLKLGAGNYMDALSIHPYREGTYPEDKFHPQRYGAPAGKCHNYADEIAYLRSVLKKYSPKKQIEIWVTEMGYSIFDKHKRGIDVSPFTQAKYLSRFCIQNLALGVDNIVWYELRDFGNVNYNDSNGITSNCVPKPAYYTYLRICKLFNQDLRVIPAEIKTSKKVQNLHQYLFEKVGKCEVLICLWQAIKAKDDYKGIVANIDISSSLPEFKRFRRYEFIDIVFGQTQGAKHTIVGNTLILKNVAIRDYPIIILLSR